MKHVPPAVLAYYSTVFNGKNPVKFAGGEDWSDGTLYLMDVAGATHVLKIMPVSDEQSFRRVHERMNYLFYLGKHGVPIVYPIPSTTGLLVEQTKEDGAAYLAYRWRKIEGEHVKSMDVHELSDFYRAWGRAVGKVHNLAKAYPFWQHSPSVDAGEKPLICWQQEMDFFRSKLDDEAVVASWDNLRERLLALPKNRDNFGFIHNDPHAHNLLITNNGVTLLDFDVANYHWFMVDIAIALYSEVYRVWQHRPVKPATVEHIRRHFLEGYHQENTLPAGELENLHLFLCYRRVLMFALFSRQIKEHDPAYWQKMRSQILDNAEVLLG